MTADPAVLFPGTLVIAVPHMDDEALALGGTIARLPEKSRVHVVYATDGSMSPVPMFRWMGAPSADLPQIREAEAKAAMRVLDVPEENLHFLRYPDGALKRHVRELSRSLAAHIDRLEPSHVFIPFRYDRHPDHLALHRAGLSAVASLDTSARVVEYFVYYRWRLIPGGDVRSLVRPERRVQVGIRSFSEQKRRALECYVSQTTRYFGWQDRPILPAARLEEVSRAPEIFLLRDPDVPGTAVFSRLRFWIPVAHRLEPTLKKWKDRCLHLLTRRSRRRTHGQ